MTKGTCSVVAAGLALGMIIAPRGGYAAPVPAKQPAAEQSKEIEQAHGSAPGEKPPVTGTVLETMTAGGYTYILLGKDGKKEWVAVPATEVKVGQEVKVKPGMAMGIFTSKSLNRSFDNIVFSPGLVTEAKGTAGTEASPIPPGLSGAGGKAKGMAAMFGSGGGEMVESLGGRVVETMDGGGYTYVNLEQDGKRTWAAVPTMKVTVGEELELQPGAVMKNFKSKSLNKTFDSVVFSGGPLRK